MTKRPTEGATVKHFKILLFFIFLNSLNAAKAPCLDHLKAQRTTARSLNTIVAKLQRFYSAFVAFLVSFTALHAEANLHFEVTDQSAAFEPLLTVFNRHVSEHIPTGEISSVIHRVLNCQSVGERMSLWSNLEKSLEGEVPWTSFEWRELAIEVEKIVNPTTDSLELSTPSSRNPHLIFKDFVSLIYGVLPEEKSISVANQLGRLETLPRTERFDLYRSAFLQVSTENYPALSLLVNSLEDCLKSTDPNRLRVLEDRLAIVRRHIHNNAEDLALHHQQFALLPHNPHLLLSDSPPFSMFILSRDNPKGKRMASVSTLEERLAEVNREVPWETEGQQRSPRDRPIRVGVDLMGEIFYLKAELDSQKEKGIHLLPEEPRNPRQNTEYRHYDEDRIIESLVYRVWMRICCKSFEYRTEIDGDISLLTDDRRYENDIVHHLNHLGWSSTGPRPHEERPAMIDGPHKDYILRSLFELIEHPRIKQLPETQVSLANIAINLKNPDLYFAAIGENRHRLLYSHNRYANFIPWLDLAKLPNWSPYSNDVGISLMRLQGNGYVTLPEDLAHWFGISTEKGYYSHVQKDLIYSQGLSEFWIGVLKASFEKDNTWRPVQFNALFVLAHRAIVNKLSSTEAKKFKSLASKFRKTLKEGEQIPKDIEKALFN